MKPVVVVPLIVALAFSANTAEIGGYFGEVTRDGPVGYYRFEDADSKNGAAAHNSSNAKTPGPDGVYRGVKLVAGPVGIGGMAASFAGDGLIEIPHQAAFEGGDVSVELWFRSTQPFDKKFWPGSATLVSKVTSGPGSGDFCLLGGSLDGGRNDGQVLVGIGPKGGGDNVMASPTGLNDGRFHHVVWTRMADGQNSLYVDGAAVAAFKDNGATIRNTRPLLVGGENIEKGTFLTGEIDELAIYSGVLSAERVKVHFAAGSADPRLPKPAQQTVDFAHDIKPIFKNTCLPCHGLSKEKGGFSLTNRARAMDGGDKGASILPGNSAASALVGRIARLDTASVMPPDGEKLSASQVGLIRAWIDQGATWPTSADEVDPRVAAAAGHWSFKPLLRPTVPKVKSAWIKSPVDAFIIARLNAAGLRPAPPATKEALLRRVSFDLTGLPPTVDEIKNFSDDARPDAYEKVVDRLLASPAYGERMARHWLDVVRYADSGGGETDIYYQQAWRYRDYVIRSFNDDKPYDRFLMEQVGGDELWPEQETMQDAVAVWTLGEWPNALDAFPEELEYVRRTDMVNTLSEAALGLSIGCANCHNHKYDPISQRDYFGLEAVFAASETWDKTRNKKAWGKGERDAYRILRHADAPTPIHMLTRGDLGKPRGLISPALPAFLPGGGPLAGGADESKQRRAGLAKWLVSPQNPLTARVIANRVWQWHFGRALAATPNDFGTQGQPPSHTELLDWLASELISNGWSLKKLSRQLVLSATYRQSAVREAKAIEADATDVFLAGFPRRRLEAEEVWDHLLAASGTLDLKSFGEPFVPKLSDEELAGMYDLEGKREKKWPVTAEQNRRAIYILNRRSFRFPFFEAFDPANNAVSCPVRQTTTVPSQALTLLNNSRVAQQAKTMAQRLTRDVGDDPEKCIRRGWLLAFSREATAAEARRSLQFLSEAEAAQTKPGKANPPAAALEQFCIGIINATEFVYAG